MAVVAGGLKGNRQLWNSRNWSGDCWTLFDFKSTFLLKTLNMLSSLLSCLSLINSFCSTRLKFVRFLWSTSFRLFSLETWQNWIELKQFLIFAISRQSKNFSWRLQQTLLHARATLDHSVVEPFSTRQIHPLTISTTTSNDSKFDLKFFLFCKLDKPHVIFDIPSIKVHTQEKPFELSSASLARERKRKPFSQQQNRGQNIDTT